MTKIKYIIILAIILLPILFFLLGRFHFSKHYLIGRNICIEKASKIKCKFWKTYDGAIIGDFLDCGENHWRIKDGILYVNEKPKAKVIGLVYRCLTNDYILTIQSLDGQETGSYISK